MSTSGGTGHIGGGLAINMAASGDASAAVPVVVNRGESDAVVTKKRRHKSSSRSKSKSSRSKSKSSISLSASGSRSVEEEHVSVDANRGSFVGASGTQYEDEVVVNTIYQDVYKRSSSDVKDGDNEVSRRRVVTRVDRLPPRLIHHEEQIEEGTGKVLKEYEFEEQVPVDYTVVRQDVVEHIVVIPTTKSSTKKQPLKPRIVEIEKRVPVEKIVDVDQVETVEVLVEVVTPSGKTRTIPNIIPKKKIVPREKKVIIERPVERIVEVPEYQYIDVEEVIEAVEVEEEHEVLVYKEVEVPTVIEVPVEEVHERDEFTDVQVLMPFGVKAETTVEYTVPTIVERRTSRGYPVYVPRFIEVPTNSIQLTPDQRFKCKQLLSQMRELESSYLDSNKIISVCEIEKMGVAARDHQTCIQGHIDASDIKSSLMHTFQQGEYVATQAAATQKAVSTHHGDDLYHVSGTHAASVASVAPATEILDQDNVRRTIYAANESGYYGTTQTSAYGVDHHAQHIVAQQMNPWSTLQYEVKSTGVTAAEESITLNSASVRAA